MNISIDKGIPIREPRTGRPGKYPWAEMVEGDSFFVPLGDFCTERMHQCILRSAWTHRLYHNVRFSTVTRLVEENSVKGIRCWRIAPKTEFSPLEIRRAG